MRSISVSRFSATPNAIPRNTHAPGASSSRVVSGDISNRGRVAVTGNRQLVQSDMGARSIPCKPMLHCAWMVLRYNRRCQYATSQQALPVRHVDPAAELEPVLAEMRDLGEAELFVQGRAGRIRQRSATDHAMDLPRAQVVEQALVQRGTETTSDVRGREIDR